MSWLTTTEQGVILTLRIVPGASRTEMAGEQDGALKIRLQAPPVEGKANKALCRFLADQCDLAKNRIVLLSGENSRHKRVLLQGITEEAVIRLVRP